MVPDRQKMRTDRTDRPNGPTDDAKTISLRLCRGIIILVEWVNHGPFEPNYFQIGQVVFERKIFKGLLLATIMKTRILSKWKS